MSEKLTTSGPGAAYEYVLRHGQTFTVEKDKCSKCNKLGKEYVYCTDKSCYAPCEMRIFKLCKECIDKKIRKKTYKQTTLY